jgi:hypothetical protein|tara:strand:+ start:3067 stop:3480 length:414 start_codon:yes stop_codon:yes gene_type:complete
LTAEQIASALEVRPDRLRLLLYALVSAGLLTSEDGRFANTAESDRFLASGSPNYMADIQAQMAGELERKLKTAESLRTGVPQAKVDFAGSPPTRLRGSFARLAYVPDLSRGGWRRDLIFRQPKRCSMQEAAPAESRL